MTTAASKIDISSASPAGRQLSVTEGWYLLNLYWLASDGEATVRKGQLADRLDVDPASVSEMVTKLTESGLCSSERYRGVELTTQGRTVAESLAWRQCVVTSYFDRVLAYAMDGDTAYRIGAILPETGLSHLEDAVDHPCTDVCRGVYQGYDGCFLEAGV